MISLLNLVCFFVVFIFFLPKGITAMLAWKKNNNPLNISLAVALFFISFSILSANYLFFIKLVLSMSGMYS